MQGKKKVFVCPYGKFPNLPLAAKAAQDSGLSNAFTKLKKLIKNDPLNYYYEVIVHKEVNNNLESEKKCTKQIKTINKNINLDKIKLANGNEVSWEEFRTWSAYQQHISLVAVSNETRQKLRNSKLSKWQDGEYRTKMSKAHVGKLHLESTKQILSKKNGTEIVTPIGRFQSIRSAARAYNVSDTTMRKWLWVSKPIEFYIANDPKKTTLN